MTVRRVVLLAIVVVLTGTTRAENAPPRDLWAQAAAAATSGDVATAVAKTNELFATGKAYGISYYPSYALTAADMARESEKHGHGEVAQWAAKAAEQLDPRSPAVAFSKADHSRDHGSWPNAITDSIEGFRRTRTTFRTRVLADADLVFLLGVVVALTASVFAVALFVRYARSMAHDFRELLGLRFHGGAVTVLASALLFLPLFLWFGPVWLAFYWFVIFFGYATVRERAAIGVLCVALALLPLAVDRAASRVAQVDNPIIQATVASSEQSYRPETLRRLEEVAGIVSDNALIHLLLGNLELQEGNEHQAQMHYRRSLELKDTAGAHVNLGNLHFLNNDFPAAMNEYERAEQLDPKLAIAYYDNSLASGEVYRFDEQAQKLGQAKRLDRALTERLTQNPPVQKVATYSPSTSLAWDVSDMLARRSSAQTIFGSYAYFDPVVSALNPITVGAIAAFALGIALWRWRRRGGFADACMKCGRTFCHRCKSSRDSATYCTQCIHIYLKRDGVSLDTKKAKLDEVNRHQTGVLRRNRLFAMILPGSAQVMEGNTLSGLTGIFVFAAFVALAVLVGRLAPALGPVADAAQQIVRVTMIALAVVAWFVLTVPIFLRRQAA